MKHRKPNQRKISFMPRRGFIKFFLASAGSLALLPVAKIVPQQSEPTVVAVDDHSRKHQQRRVFVFQDIAHFDLSRNVEEYIPPKVMASTRDYVNQTDELKFLQQHWFV